MKSIGIKSAHVRARSSEECNDQTSPTPSSPSAEPLWLNGGAVAILFDPQYSNPHLIGRTGDAALAGAIACSKILHTALMDEDNDHGEVAIAYAADALSGISMLLEIVSAANRSTP